MKLTKKDGHLFMMIVHLIGMGISLYLLLGKPWETFDNMQKFTRIILLIAFSIGFITNLADYRKEKKRME